MQHKMWGPMHTHYVVRPNLSYLCACNGISYTLSVVRPPTNCLTCYSICRPVDLYVFLTCAKSTGNGKAIVLVKLQFENPYIGFHPGHLCGTVRGFTLDQLLFGLFTWNSSACKYSGAHI